MTAIIGLMGPAGSGKSSAAAYLAACYGARRYSLADPLKNMVRAAFDLTEAQVRGTQAEKEAIDPRYNRSPRWLLQRIGTEGCRNTFGPGFWVSRLLEQIDRERPQLAVIDDVRFINETEAIRDRGLGFVWLLRPPGPAAISVSDGHQTETDWTRATVDIDIAPKERGLDVLHSILRTSAAACGLRPAVLL